MIGTHTGLEQLSVELRLARERWFLAYQTKDVFTLSLLETKEFFAVYYQNVEKKSQWHHNILQANQQTQDPLKNIAQATKVRCDTLSQTSCVITSYFKGIQDSHIIKEMWVKYQDCWQIASLALTNTYPKKP